MEFRLPRPEDTQVKITHDEGKPPIVMDLLDLDDIHVDASTLAKKKAITVHEAFDLLFQEAHGISLTRSQVWLLLTYKEKKLNELKKNCSDSPYLFDSSASQPDSTPD
jgi:hypothetical protein